MTLRLHCASLAGAVLLAGCGTDTSRDHADQATAAQAFIGEEYHEGRAAPVAGRTFEEARTAGDATFAFFFVPSSGFAYHDDAARLTGVTVELLRGFARYVTETHGIDVTVRWIEEPLWADFYGHVRDSRGAAFGVGNVTITEAREEELDFSPPYLRNIAVLVTHEDVPELVAVEQIGHAFAGLTALLYPGTLHETRLLEIRDAHFPDMPTREIATDDEFVAAVVAGPTTFGYTDIPNYWRAREAQQPLRRHPVGDEAAETFGIILPDGSDWTPVMNAYMQQIGGAEGATLTQLLRQHLGDELAALLAGG